VAQNFSLALFCSQYLLSAPFRKTIDNSKIQEYAHSGYYALQDYAVSSIFAHFHATFEDGMGDKQVSSVEFHSSLQLFISEYGKALRLKMSTANTFSAPPELHHQLPSDPVKRYALFDLERRTSLIRNVLEGVRNDDSLQHERKMTLKAIYGPETYKCPRPWCVHFLNGLDTVEDRERHIHRHDSPFICPDEQCPFHQIGFDTEASLNRHITQYHSLIQADSQTTFPQPRPTREDTLCAAAERGDLNSVQKHIDDGAIVNKATRPNGSRTPLYLAAQNGHLAICDLLIRHGANIHSGSGPWRLNALTTAIKNGKEDIVRYLLNTKTLLVGRPTPLECAAAFHRLGMLKCVIDKLGSQLAPFELGYALRMASERGNVELAMLLIELLQSRFTDQLSATINWQGDGFHRWTHPALVTSLTRPIRWDNGKATTEIDTTHTPLHVAARNGHHSLVQLLLDIQADPSPAYILPTSRDLAGPTWATPLYDAAQNGHTEVVRLLLEADADPNEQCGFMAPLHIAAQKGHAKIVGLILDSGKVSMDAISLFKVAIRGNVNIPALHMLTLAKEIDPPATIEVGAVHCESNGVASEWYTFSNPDVQKVIEIDLLQNFDFEAEYHIRSITFSEDGRYLAASTDNSVDVYDAISSHQIGSIDISASELADGPLEHLCFSPDGSHLLGTFRATLWLWNISTSVSSSCSSWHEGTINAVAYTPDGRSVLTGSTDRTIRMWDISGDGQPMHIHTLKLDHGATSFAVSPDDQYLVIGDMAGNIWLWDMNSRATFASQLSHGVGSFKGKIKHLSFYLDGRYLVCHQESQPIQSLQWMPRSSRNDKPGLGKLATLPCRGESEGFRGSCVTADQQWLLSRQCLGKIFIQNATHGKVQAVLQTHAENVCSLVCSRAGCVFATASDNQVRVWKMREI
jgi:ankyrin repeat protein